MKITESQKQALMDNLQLESMSDIPTASSMANITQSLKEPGSFELTMRCNVPICALELKDVLIAYQWPCAI